MKECFALPIPPIEIRIEEDKEMWQAYIDGLNALLENKRDLIKIQHISKQKGGLLKLDFDMDSYAQNLKNAIADELKGKCEKEASVSVDDGECMITFDSYQSIPEDTIESIKTIGRDYCYHADSEPTNTVSGKIAIISDAAVISNPEFFNPPFTLSPTPVIISLRLRSLISSTRFHNVCFNLISC